MSEQNGTIERAEGEVGRAEKALEHARDRLRATEIVLARFPDAVPLNEYRADGFEFVSVLSLAEVDRFDPARAQWQLSPRFVAGVLYELVMTSEGGVEARVYSPARVDLVDGFRRHFEEGIPVVEALRSTTGSAEAAYRAHEEDRKDALRVAQAEIARAASSA